MFNSDMDVLQSLQHKPFFFARCTTQDATLNMTFSINYYLDLHNAISFHYCCNFLQVNLLMFYNVQTTNLTIFGKI